jgi:hypothetical protein
MSRILFLLLLTANLLFLAWSQLSTPAAGKAVVRAGAATAAEPPPMPAPATCTTIGPFADADAVAQAAAKLIAGGKHPEARTEDIRRTDGYAVYVTGLKDAAAQQAALKVLRRGGVQDVAPVADDPAWRMLAGQLPDRDSAELRAQRLRALKLEAGVEEQFVAESRHWLNVPGESPAILTAAQVQQLGLGAPNLVTAVCP